MTTLDVMKIRDGSRPIETRVGYRSEVTDHEDSARRICQAHATDYKPTRKHGPPTCRTTLSPIVILPD